MDAIEKLYDISKDAAFAEATYCNNKNEVDLLKDFIKAIIKINKLDYGW
jgi:hypothetical protein